MSYAESAVPPHRGLAIAAAGAVARGAPDEYTLLIATTGVMAIDNAFYKTMSYAAAAEVRGASIGLD